MSPLRHIFGTEIYVMSVTPWAPGEALTGPAALDRGAIAGVRERRA